MATCSVTMHSYSGLWLHGAKGSELCKAIRLLLDKQIIPVVLISALNDLEGIASDCGANFYIPKPFDIGYLLEVVNRFV